jgi:MFS family permease
VLPLGLGAIISYFGISKGEAGLLTTVTLVVSALGGALAGILADRIGRVRTLQLTVATYTVFTVLCGFAPNFETLLVLRALQGLGFGVEWAAGAILVAEYAKPRYRGRAVAFAQSAWAVGWGLSVVVYTIVFSFASPDIAWRLLFWTGVIPAGAGDLDPAVCPGRRHHDRTPRTNEQPRFVRRDLPGRPGPHHPVRVAAGDRRTRRLLHARHLAADLPQGIPRLDRRRHRR